MIRSAFIKIWGKDVGAVSWDPDNEVASFEYEPSFLNSGFDLSPIMMPVSQSRGRIWTFTNLRKSETFKGLPGLLADILPDKYGNALLNEWLTINGRPSDSLNPVEMLCFIGKRGMGALEINPSTYNPVDKNSPIEIGSMVEIAKKILNDRKNFKVDLTNKEEAAFNEILRIGSSAGGMRAKALIAYNEKTEEIRSGQVDLPKDFTHWLIKFDGLESTHLGHPTGYGRVEMAYSYMAREAEIEMTDCRLFDENGRSHFITQRFDRDPIQGKIHIQSFCAMRHFDYNDVGVYSYEQLFETMRMMRLPYPQAEQLYRRMVFNVMGRNCDDHTKNFAFMMNKSGAWKLSPAFDVTYAYKPGSLWVSQHSMSINGKRKDITRDDLIMVGKQMNIKRATEIIDQIKDIMSRWKTYADRAKVSTPHRDEINKNLILL